MSRLGAIATATGGVTRHKVQALVIGTVLLIATASAALGFTLLVTVNAPYQHAFTAQRGADLTVTVNAAHAGSREPAATRSLPGVTAVAGPFAETTVQMSYEGNSLGPRTLAGRASAGGSVDDLVLSEGHWPDGPGQLVLNAGPGGGPGYPGVGDTVDIGGASGVHTLVVTGFAESITKATDGDGWVTPAEAVRLSGRRGPATAQMLYRFAHAGDDAQVRADTAEIVKALPAGAVAGTGSWLTTERTAAGNAAIIEPFVVAFALIGLAMAVMIVGNVVSGAVVAQYHRIGVLKSIGLTPTQVVAAYLGRIGAPALAGCLAGVVAGELLAIPVLHRSSGIYGVRWQQPPLWIAAAPMAGMLVLTVLAALGPALRAGRLSAVEAISAGRAPRAGRGHLAHRLAAATPLPRPAGIGLAAPFARPARTLMTLAAIAFGVTAVILAVGLSSALGRVEASQTLSATAPVRIQPADTHATPPSGAPVEAALRAQRGTLRYVAVYGAAAEVPGVAKEVTAQVFDGGSSWLGYDLVAGRWYRPGEVDVNSAFLADGGPAIGDTATIDLPDAAPVTVRIAGEVFDPSDNPLLFAGAGTLNALAGPRNLQGYDVGLRPGTDVTAYTRALGEALGPHWTAAPPQGNSFYPVAVGLVTMLAVMVAVTAGLGVFNTVLMTTRDRLHDLGVFKAIGMRPGQVLTMVVCWIAGPALLAAVIAAPVAVELTDVTVRAMGNAAHTALPADFTQVLPGTRLALLSLAAIAIAVAGALLPAGWAARARPAVALRTE